MTRAEHLDWAKKRALEYVDRGSTTEAMASMFSDLGKHLETRNSLKIGIMIALAVNPRDPESVRRWINGFN
jgi:hypothetical protein